MAMESQFMQDAFNPTQYRNGKKFEVAEEYTKITKLHERNHFTNLTEDTVRDFVFATAASSNHFNESIDAVDRTQRFFPNYIIVFYDIGLLPTEVEQVHWFSASPHLPSVMLIYGQMDNH